MSRQHAPAASNRSHGLQQRRSAACQIRIHAPTPLALRTWAAELVGWRALASAV